MERNVSLGRIAVAMIYLVGMILASLQSRRIDLLEESAFFQSRRIDELEKSLMEVRSYRNLQSDSPFQRTNKRGNWVTEDRIIFTKGIIIGHYNPNCDYGNATLSVDMGYEGRGNNCPSGEGSVAFGYKNEANGTYSTVTGGRGNIATNTGATVTGGKLNEASGWYSTVTGGSNNQATWSQTVVAGGFNNRVSGLAATVTGGRNNEASGVSTSVTGGINNKAAGEYATVTGGYENRVTSGASYSSISGGIRNEVSGKYGSILGGSKNLITNEDPSMIPIVPFNCTGNRCVSEKKLFKFSKGILVKGEIVNPQLVREDV